MKKNNRKLSISKTTISNLNNSDLSNAKGGSIIILPTMTCQGPICVETAKCNTATLETC